MKLNSIFKKVFFATAIIWSVPVSGQQTNQEKIQAKWNLSQFEFEKPSQNSKEIQKEIRDIIITFEKSNMIVSKRTEGCEQFIKSIHYSLNEDAITIGNDKAEVLLLDEHKLKIKIAGQGVLHFTKN